MRRVVLALCGWLAAGTAGAWPYETYPDPSDLAPWTVAASVALPAWGGEPGGTVELLGDARITKDNVKAVQAFMKGAGELDEKLEASFDKTPPRKAILRFRTTDGKIAPLVVLDEPYARVAVIKPCGDGRPVLMIDEDYGLAHKGWVTYPAQIDGGRIEPVHVLDLDIKSLVPAEIHGADKAWWRTAPKGNKIDIHHLDARFADRVELARFSCVGKTWERAIKIIKGPPVGYDGAANFPKPEMFP